MASDISRTVSVATVDPHDRVRIGIDFGGTKIEAAALGPDGKVLSRIRRPAPDSYSDAISILRNLIEETEQAIATSATIGIGTPGSLSPHTHEMRNANATYLNGRRLRDDLEAALGRPVRIANDANCFALSEAIDGAAAGMGTVFALIIGTGCGGGVAIGGQVLAGANGLAGEIGHVPLPWPSAQELDLPSCWCGKTGCLESWISGTGFTRAYAAATGRSLPAPAIVERMRSGEPDATAAFAAYADRLARALGLVANLIDPDAIVLGGGMSNVTELYPDLAEHIGAYTFSGIWQGVIAPARWGDSSGVRGAAWLWE